ncbi:MAG: phosphonopyruvate decarboxylase [Lachnospiraceae bacterium]
MKAVWLIHELTERGIGHFIGVPDSTLSDFCKCLERQYADCHEVPANEGAAVALAAGHYLAEQKPCLVYMQNSGIGNAVNPICSLIHEKVYRIPVLFFVGYRGEPGKKDEPQHVFQGEVTIPLLNQLGIPCEVIGSETTEEEMKAILDRAWDALADRKPYAVVIKKGTFEKETAGTDPGSKKTDSRFGADVPFTMKREDAIRVFAEYLKPEDAVISTTGKISRELYEQLDQQKGSHSQAFLTVGSMGHASMIALGFAESRPDKRVYCLDGDGAALMHLGAMAFIGEHHPKNLVHLVLNNRAHESVGGMATGAVHTDWKRVAESLGYLHAYSVKNETELRLILEECQELTGPVFIEVKVALGAREDLGRPKERAQENGDQFVNYHQSV